MLKKVFFTMLLLLAVVSNAKFSHAHDSDVDLDDHVLIIETDDSHDIVVVRVDPNDADEIEVLILQFDDPVSLLDFNSEEEIIDAADDFRNEYEDIDDVNSIEVYTLGGKDTIIIGAGLQIPCKLVGGDDDDFIFGSSVADEIYGDGENVNGPESGDDEINANAGDDTVYGGPGDDDINGGLHNDTLFGNAGADNIRGWSGDDEIHGGAGDDDLYGNSGNDDLYGDSGEDDMDGGADNDDMWGGSGDDNMYGGTGDDDLHGDSGDDDLYGEAGRDAMFGGNDNDFLDGSYDGETDLMEGGNGADEFVNRYFENRSYTYWEPIYIRVPMWVFNGGRFRVIYENRLVGWITRTGTYQATLEVETVVDYNSVQGDTLSPVEIN